jgi:hypothetical protein
MMNAGTRRLGGGSPRGCGRRETDAWRSVEIACLGERGSGGGANEGGVGAESA